MTLSLQGHCACAMVWFQCDCGETLKKPKVQSHLQRCSAPQLTCIDCSQSFSRTTVQVGHLAESLMTDLAGPQQRCLAGSQPVRERARQVCQRGHQAAWVCRRRASSRSHAAAEGAAACGPGALVHQVAVRVQVTAALLCTAELTSWLAELRCLQTVQGDCHQQRDAAEPRRRRKARPAGETSAVQLAPVPECRTLTLMAMLRSRRQLQQQQARRLLQQPQHRKLSRQPLQQPHRRPSHPHFQRRRLQPLGQLQMPRKHHGRPSGSRPHGGVYEPMQGR